MPWAEDRENSTCPPMPIPQTRRLDVPQSTETHSLWPVTRASWFARIGLGGAVWDLSAGHVEPHELGLAPWGLAVPAPTRRLEHHPVARAQGGHELGGHDLLATIGAVDDGAGRGTVLAPGAALWGDEVSLAAMCEAHLAVQHLVFPHDAEAAAPMPRTTRIWSQRDAMHADWGI